VHYVDVMCQVTGAKPVRVHAIGARLSEEISEGMYNYGCLQVTFDDGSIGWYEAGWGAMMSETAFFVKDMIGPKGCVSIAMDERKDGLRLGRQPHQDECATRASRRADWRRALRQARRNSAHGRRAGPSGAVQSRAAAFLAAIRNDEDLSEHARGAVDSLRIVLAADRSVRTAEVVTL